MTLRRNTELFPRPPLPCSEDALPRFDTRTGHRVCILVCGSQVGVLVIVVSFQKFWRHRIHIPTLLCVDCIGHLFDSSHCSFIALCQFIFP